MKKRILVTGAAGRIGSYFAKHHGQSDYDLRLMVRGSEERIDMIRDFGEVVVCDLADQEGLKCAAEEMDVVIHLAGDPSPTATWDSLLPTNIVGTYNVCAAAKAAGCKRLLYASSIHAVSGYPTDVQVKTGEPVNPGDLYGVTKCFGEAMVRYMAEQEGISAIAIRIGAFQPIGAAEDERAIRMMDAWVSERDLTQLIVRCIAAENIRFAIFNGLSGNRFNRLDISDAREKVGYTPEDDFTRYSPQLRDLRLSETLDTHSLKDYPNRSGLREDIKPS